MEVKRNCPSCNKELVYTNKYNLIQAEKNKRICRECANKLHKERMSGQNNPFFGRKHTQATKEKLSKSTKQIWENMSQEEKDTLIKKTTNRGEKNGMYGKSPYDIWLEKYGKEEADKRFLSWKTNQLKNAPKGEGHPMYGKNPSNNSGNGWKSIYNGFYCRSLRELMFLIECFEQKLEVKSAENIRIKYELNGKLKTYAPDFLIGNKLYEIKPIRLHNSLIVRKKAEAAKQYCKENNLEYILIDVAINYNKIKLEHDLGNVIFDKRYKDKFLNYFNTVD